MGVKMRRLDYYFELCRELGAWLMIVRLHEENNCGFGRGEEVGSSEHEARNDKSVHFQR